MPKPIYQPAVYLSDRGKKIFKQIVKHIEDNGNLMLPIDVLELSMLANSFDLYHKMIEDMGGIYTQECKNGTQPRAEYNIMQQCYKYILSHSGRFGMNPADREKIFAGMKKKVVKKLDDGLDDDEETTTDDQAQMKAI